MTGFQVEKAETSAIVLANASELVARVMLNIAGNDLSNKMGLSTITMSSLRSLALARFQKNLNLTSV